MIGDLAESRWTPGRAREWHERAGAIRGVNYLPRTAVNTTEMWQADTFDPATVDQELGWAARACLCRGRPRLPPVRRVEG